MCQSLGRWIRASVLLPHRAVYLQCAGATSRRVPARFRPMHIYFVLSIALSSGKAPD
jgi:hypothetical protein